ncbi:TPA: DUF550 domain-containing protein [Klebsiella michiganensis]|nr:DUF550 domain-containing protein [Klebsiella michiganensis]
MTKSTITREQLIKKAQEQIEFCRHTKITGEGRAHVNQCAALFEIALAAMDSEPVGTFRKSAVGYTPSHHEDAVPLYAAPQLSPERDQVRREHADWSQATFGNVGPVGPLKHLSKEALEAAAEPGDLSEWADMQFLLWDAQRRAGITDEQITQAMIEKLVVNKQRSWPEPKEGEPRLHIKEQPAPVVPDERAAFNAWNNEDNLPIAGVSAKNAAWLAWQARAELAGNSPVIPDGYVMVPKEPTEQMYDAGDRQMATKQVWDAMLAAAPQQHNAPQNIPEIIPGWIPVSERMPEPGILVLVYTPPQPGDYPGDVRIGFDYIDPDGDDPTYWFNHGESYEHFCCVACDGMTGPSEKAPYTHWMPLPAAPQEVKGD